MVNVRNDGAVNSGANEKSSVISDAGTCSVASGGIGGKLVSQAVSQAPLMLLLHRPRRPPVRCRVGGGGHGQRVLRMGMLETRGLVAVDPVWQRAVRLSQRAVSRGGWRG